MYKTMMRSLSSCLSFLAILLLCVSCSSSEIVVHNLDERAANEILTFLHDRGIAAQKEMAAEGGGGGTKVVLWNIKVDGDRAKEAMALLNSAGLPRRPGINLLGIFANQGLVPSELQEQIRYQAGLAEQLSNVIRKFDGVLDADVQLSFPKEDPLNPTATRGPVTASVYVKHTGVLDDPNSHLETKIRRYLASAISGLSFDNVTVVGELARYGDGSVDFSVSSPSSEKQLVSVWSVVIAKESVARFRVIFFSFFIAILVLICVAAWLVWKLLPLLHQPGGLKHLFTFTPFEVSPTAEKKAEEAAAPKEGEAPPHEEGTTPEEGEEDVEESDEEDQKP